MTYAVEIIARQALSDGFLKLWRYRLARRLAWPEPACARQAVGGPAVTGRTLVDLECIGGLGAAAVLPYDSETGQVVLVEQLRVGALTGGRGAVPGGLVLEPPGGAVGPGEAPAAAARREAWEEAGCRIGAMTPIGTCRPSPGYSDECVELFCGEVSVAGLPSHGGEAGEGESTRVAVWGLDALIRELGRGPFTPATLIIAVQWLALNRESVGDRWAADGDPCPVRGPLLRQGEPC